MARDPSSEGFLARLDKTTIAALNAGAPAWLADLRNGSFAHFNDMEMPTQGEEVWRYVDLDFELTDYELADQPGAISSQEDLVRRDLVTESAGLVVDGHTVSISEASPNGVRISSLGESQDAQAELIQDLFERGVPPDLDIFSAAHHAFLPDGIVVQADRNAVPDDPVLIQVQAVTPDKLSLPHVSISVGENAEVSVVISYHSVDGGRHLVVPQVDIAVEAGGRCALTAVQAWGSETRSIAHARVHLENDASLLLAEVGLGARFSRLHITVDLDGRGASSEVLGLYFGERDQVFDYRAFINHRGTSTTSDMFLKGAVEDEASSVFTGLIKIWEDATRTNAFQTNRNLILSDGAKAESVPNLEILCDDVLCGHASTSGPLDLDQLYYVKSRGLRQPRAERLLVRGFFEEIIRRLPEVGVAEPVRAEVNRKFIEAQVAGRV